MQKTKLALVSLLGLLVVLAPAASALAQSPNMEKTVKTKKKELSSNKGKARGGVFNEIKKEGAKPVSNKKLDQKQGEGWFGAVTGAISGAFTGAATSVGHYLWNKSVMGHEIPDVHKVAHHARRGAEIGAASGAFFGSFMPF